MSSNFAGRQILSGADHDGPRWPGGRQVLSRTEQIARVFPDLQFAWVENRQNLRDRLTLTIRLRGLRAGADLQAAMMERALAVADLAENNYVPGMILSVVLNYMERVNAVRRPRYDFENRPMHLRGRFRDIVEVAQDLPAQLLETMAGMLNSSANIDLANLSIDLNFDRPLEARAGKIPAYMLKSIDAPVDGLEEFDPTDGLCAFESIAWQLFRREEIRKLWTGDFSWFKMTRFDRLLAKPYRDVRPLTHNAQCIMRECSMTNWPMYNNYENGANQFILKQPKYQILIFAPSKQLISRHKGMLCDGQLDSTMIFFSTLGGRHIAPIKSLRKFFGYRGTNKFCPHCLKFKPVHVCMETDIQCIHCCLYFKSSEDLRIHCKPDRMRQFKCNKCEKEFVNESCQQAHQCTRRFKIICDQCHRAKDENHVCGSHKCTVCLKDQMRNHRCFMQKPDIEDGEKTAQECGKNYYAFDVESMFTRQPDGSDKHHVNLVVLMRCFSDEPPLVFNSLHEFVSWIENLSCSVKLFAHNLKGYDARLVFDFLFENNRLPQNISWRGSKIMKMSYGRAQFMDTLLHLPSSLAGLPKMFGMDETQFKKGFFPYKFNLQENQNYTGPIPDVLFFDPDGMSPKSREKFMQWHLEERDKPYDFRKELVDYCINDTLILKKAIELYMVKQMEFKPIDPFSCTTIASYAMKIYQMYYMPADQIAILRKHEHDDIARSMHGGRTDVRCLLREWTPEEIVSGHYGVYQDVQSLYPTVQFYDDLPAGVPKRKEFGQNNQPTLFELKEVFGFVCCDIKPTKYLHHPVLVESRDNKLLAHLQPMENAVIPTPELKLALENGYVVTRVYWWYEFTPSRTLFKPYFQDFLKAKIHASGMPRWVQTDEDWQEFHRRHAEMGIALERDKMLSNPGAKIGAKLLLNSLWGKFGENSVYSRYCSIDMDTHYDQYMGIENRWYAGDIDINHRRYTQDGNRMYMIYTPVERQETDNNVFERLRLARVNMAIASFVTSHARCRLWQEMNKLGKRVLYHDTDSIIYERDPQSYNIPIGRYLGEWEDESDGKPIVSFVSTGPKCYTIVTQNNDGTVDGQSKVKGVTLNYMNQQKIDYSSMKKLVLGQLDWILTDSLLFKYNIRANTMVTCMVKKLYKETYNKGIKGNNYRVYPFGSEQFIDILADR